MTAVTERRRESVQEAWQPRQRTQQERPHEARLQLKKGRREEERERLPWAQQLSSLGMATATCLVHP